jgi:hypothetical protein
VTGNAETTVPPSDGRWKGNVTPSKHFVDVVSRLVADWPDTPLRIAEIGVAKGATTFEIVKILRPGDRLDLFDRDNCALASNLDALVSQARCRVDFFPNSTKAFDSYFWTIGRMKLAQPPEEAAAGTWDAVYLDGSHTYPADAPTACLLKEMVKPGGLLILDDMFWNMATSPTCNTTWNRERFTDEQMAANHIEMIVDLFLRPDPRFTELTGPTSPRAVFRKAAG